jgi:hypothetical protein
MSRAEPCIGSTGIGSFSGEVDGDGDDDGIDCATPRKKSNMYCNDAGSYCEENGYIVNVNRWVCSVQQEHELLTVDVRQQGTHRPRGTNSYGHLEANHSEKAIRGQIPVESTIHPEKA